MYPYLRGYGKGFSTQHVLLSLIERWNGGTVLKDLSRVFDTLNHELFTAKFSAYAFTSKQLRLMESYLTKKYQRTKINKSFSKWKGLSQGVPQG